MSRGAHFRDRLLVEEDNIKPFMRAVESAYTERRRLALVALERLLRAVDESEDMQPLDVMFAAAVQEARRVIDATDDISSHILPSYGYIRLRTALVTPSRVRFMTPEWQMSNRVLRSDSICWPPDRFLRVIYRDEDNSKVEPRLGKQAIDHFWDMRL